MNLGLSDMPRKKIVVTEKPVITTIIIKISGFEQKYYLSRVVDYLKILDFEPSESTDEQVTMVMRER